MTDLRLTTADVPSFLADFFTNNRGTNYPPYDLEAISESEYRITVAVAGFNKEELTVTIDTNVLEVKGVKVPPAPVDEELQYPITLHSGIAKRDFQRSFKLMNYVFVSDVALKDGLLVINLKRELPDALKPRTLEIS
jgi:molecular chaperone IbpA